VVDATGLRLQRQLGRGMSSPCIAPGLSVPGVYIEQRVVWGALRSAGALHALSVYSTLFCTWHYPGLQLLTR